LLGFAACSSASLRGNSPRRTDLNDSIKVSILCDEIRERRPPKSILRSSLEAANERKKLDHEICVIRVRMLARMEIKLTRLPR